MHERSYKDFWDHAHLPKFSFNALTVHCAKHLAVFALTDQCISNNSLNKYTSIPEKVLEIFFYVVFVLFCCLRPKEYGLCHAVIFFFFF